MGAGASAVTLDDFNSDNLDHIGKGFVDGTYEYLAKQLHDYEGVRNSERMTPIARALNMPRRAALARYIPSRS